MKEIDDTKIIDFKFNMSESQGKNEYFFMFIVSLIIQFIILAWSPPFRLWKASID